MSSARPGLFQRLKYMLGRPLPAEMSDWVRNDVTGRGHVRRYMVRGFLPLIPILIAFAFVPGPVIYRICMMLLLVIPLVYFQVALIRVYRRHLLSTNGLDPELVNAKRESRRQATRSEYENLYPRK